MIQEWELIQSRVISGSGVLKVPADVTRNRMYILYSDVVRDAKSKYVNLDWNPTRSRYGNIVFLRKNYVVGAYPVEYPQQCFDGINDISGQTLEAIKCSYAGVLQSIYNLAVALSGTVGGVGLNATTIDNAIADFTFLRLSWDELRVKCYADTALQLRLYRLRYDGCVDAETADIDAPIPDAPIPKVPSGTPISSLTLPYDSSTSDNGNTVPFPGDSVPPPPSNKCIRIRNKGIQSGDVVFENFVCGITVETPTATPYNGQATVSIIVKNVAGDVVLSAIQASFASNAVEWSYVLSDTPRQSQYSYGSCQGCQ